MGPVIIESNPDALAAFTLHKQMGEFLSPKVAGLPSDESRQIFWRLVLQSVQKNLTERTPPKPPKPTRATSADEADAMVDQIRDLADQICENGQEFADSVLEKAEAIAETVEQRDYATDGQLQALENMLEGLRAWFHD